MLTRPVNILLVEDNNDDSFLIVEAFKEIPTKNKVHVVTDGVEAIEFLRNEKKYIESPLPDLILLDLLLPRKDGMDLLREIKKDQKFQTIPIIVLTVLKSDSELKKAYDLYANAYIVKPSNLDGYVKMANSIENFWLKNVNLPTFEFK